MEVTRPFRVNTKINPSAGGWLSFAEKWAGGAREGIDRGRVTPPKPFYFFIAFLQLQTLAMPGAILFSHSV